VTDEEWFSAHLARYRGLPGAQADLPGFPSDETQLGPTGLVGESTLREAFDFYRDVRDRCGRSLTSGARLLDFGAGWGRISRFFLREIERKNLFGIDVDPDLIRECRSAFGTENFASSSPFPPSPFPENFFGIVAGYSVFSHLSKDACDSWMREFHRILQPGGMVALTTRGRFFFDYCASLGESTDFYGRALASMFDDFAAARARYDAGEFVHTAKGGVAGGGPRSGDFYGETFIPRKYAETAWSQQFRLVEFLDSSPTGKHPVMFFERMP
jgi:SAM-dependent methyltransferase